VLINSTERESGTPKWPPILGLFKSVAVTLTYMRHNRTQAEIGESFGVSQPTISRAIKVITPLIAEDLGGYVPTADELDAGSQYIVDGTLLPCWSWANTRDFRCLWRSGLLPLSSSVSVFESGCVVPPRECWHDFGPRVAAGLRAVPRSAAPGGRGGFSFLTVPASAAGYEKPGANTVTCGFPVTVCLVAVACRNFGRAS